MRTALRHVGLTERYWQNATFASAYEGRKALHAEVIQLWYGQMTSGSLHEHFNL
jgi:hypothetical protein